MTSPRSTTTALQRFQQWYKAQCNGEWEHSCGVGIATLDNPGWSLEIDLADTPLQHKMFTEVKRDYEQATEWITCFLRGKVSRSVWPGEARRDAGNILGLGRRELGDAHDASTPVM